jgi:hypothetical protein
VRHERYRCKNGFTESHPVQRFHGTHSTTVYTVHTYQPFMAMLMSKANSPVRRSCRHALVSKALTVPEAAANVVVSAARAPTWLVSVGTVSSKADPALKPYQQNHNIMVPSICNDVECPLVRPSRANGWPLASVKRPRRGPRIYVAYKAVMPPVTCTTPLPAKSTMPIPTNGLGLDVDKYP